MTATTNAYGNPAVRLISSLRGEVESGNSGGPLVDSAGKVIGTVFAEITNAPTTSRVASRFPTASSGRAANGPGAVMPSAPTGCAE